MKNNFDILLKYIMVGSANTGKTALMMRLVDGTFPKNISSTIAVDFGTKTFETGCTIIKAAIFDTAGQQSFLSVTRSYFKQAIIAIVVFDLTNRRSFDDLDQWMNEINTYGHKFMKVVLVGNKCDEDKSIKITRKQAEQYANRLNVRYFQTSAKDNVNVSEIFLSTAKEILETIQAKKIPAQYLNQNIGIKINNQKICSEDTRTMIQIGKKKEKSCSC